MRNLTFIVFCFVIFACDKDDENTTYNCENVESKGEIILNEKNYTLQRSGRGIDLREDGYEVSLFYSF